MSEGIPETSHELTAQTLTAQNLGPEPEAPARPSLNEGGAGVSHSELENPKINWRRVFFAFLPLFILGLLIALDVPICPSRGLLGIPCPGCGLTRATEALAVGDFASMLRFHPLAPLLTPLVMFSVIRATARSAGLIGPSKKDPLGRLPNWFWSSFMVVLLGLWIGRMAGFFGGLPDPLDLTSGFLYRAGAFVYELIESLF